MKSKNIKTSYGVISKTDDKLIIHNNDGTIEGFIKPSVTEGISDNIRYSIELFVLVGLGITYFNTDITIVNGRSMEPTYNNHKIIIRSTNANVVNKITVSKNCIVKFKSPSGDTSIKRVVGIPGDELEFNAFTIKVNGKVVTTHNVEPHPSGGTKIPAKNLKNKYRNHTYPTNTIIKLKENEYYVLGDNKVNSIDSKHYGPIHLNSIISIVDK
jgi:signal peptidase I